MLHSSGQLKATIFTTRLLITAFCSQIRVFHYFGFLSRNLCCQMQRVNCQQLNFALVYRTLHAFHYRCFAALRYNCILGNYMQHYKSEMILKICNSWQHFVLHGDATFAVNALCVNHNIVKHIVSALLR